MLVVVKMGFGAKKWTVGVVVFVIALLLESHDLCDDKPPLICSRAFYVLRLKPQLLSGGQTMQENACSGESQLESVSALKSFMPCTDN